MAIFLAEGFVVQDECDFTFLPHAVFLDGAIYCLGAIQVEVEKTIAILHDSGMRALVQTRSFRYNAWVKNGNNILHYESAVGHRPLPHKRTFDTFGDGGETLCRVWPHRSRSLVLVKNAFGCFNKRPLQR